MERRVILALDGMSKAQALELARMLEGALWGCKVNDLLLDEGLEIVRGLKKFGRVFADPKLHDIPNTVANGVKKLAAAGADLITCHASGGQKMLTAAAKAAGAAKILAVTVLTSLGEEDTRQIYRSNVREAVTDFARSALAAGVAGVVCSPNELSLLAQEPVLRSLLKVTPGVRPLWHVKPDDQTRVTTPAEALRQGADYIVVGRPVIEHGDPREAVRLLNEELDAVNAS